jgi:hypothetical protein
MLWRKPQDKTGKNFALVLVLIKNANTMAKYSEKASEKVEEVMHEMKEGKLKSGSGKKSPAKTGNSHRPV